MFFWTGFLYFLDVQLDGDLDLPHRIGNLERQGNTPLYRFFKRLADWLETTLTGRTPQANAWIARIRRERMKRARG